MLFDMHCHLGFYDDPAGAAQALAARGTSAMSCTVTPGDYERERAALARAENARVAVGAHPWWVADGRVGSHDVERACEIARRTRWVGEIGLDYARGRAATRDEQLCALRRIVSTCKDGGHVLSIHAVRSTGDVLDELERTGATESNSCVLHWFSGTSSELTRAMRMGCLFSVGPRMLATRRGRAYVRQIPADRLLLETDLPEQVAAAPQSAPDDMVAGLRQALATLRVERGEDVAAVVAETSARLLR